MDEKLTYEEYLQIKDIKIKCFDFGNKAGIAVILEDGTRKIIATIDLIT